MYMHFAWSRANKTKKKLKPSDYLTSIPQLLKVNNDMQVSNSMLMKNSLECKALECKNYKVE